MIDIKITSFQESTSAIFFYLILIMHQVWSREID